MLQRIRNGNTFLLAILTAIVLLIVQEDSVCNCFVVVIFRRQSRELRITTSFETSSSITGSSRSSSTSSNSINLSRLYERRRTLQDEDYYSIFNTEATTTNRVGSSSTLYNNKNTKQQQQVATAAGSKQIKKSPMPVMPSQLFQDLALSQLELLASSIPIKNNGGKKSSINRSKIKSMALYLPQENVNNGQLEFIPVVIYPNPKLDGRVFIANDSQTGTPPALPMTLTKLPGFAHATTLLPTYPMVSMMNSNINGNSNDNSSDNNDNNDNAGVVGVVEEVLCDIQNGGTALSVPLFSGIETVGVLLVSPRTSSKNNNNNNNNNIWTEQDRKQIRQAAKSLSIALSMDREYNILREHNKRVQNALSDSLHQVKNPLQALRTYGKLLQRRMADITEISSSNNNTPQLLELADHLMVQSDRLVERLKPVDAIIDSLIGVEKRPPALKPVEAKALVPWKTPLLTSESDNSNAVVKTTKARPVFDDTFGNLEDDDVNSSNNELGKNLVPVLPSSNGRSDDSSDSTVSTVDNQNTILSSPLFDDNDIKMEMSFISDVLEPIISSFRAIATDRNIQFIVDNVDDDDLPGVYICPKALQEVVINVLDNAFKYITLKDHDEDDNEYYTTPTVRVRLLPNPTNYKPGVTILIEDNGPGIPIHERENVFQRGIRIINNNQNENEGKRIIIDGSGIGLHIAKTLIEMMGGTIQIINTNIYPNSLTGTVVEIRVFRKVPS